MLTMGTNATFVIPGLIKWWIILVSCIFRNSCHSKNTTHQFVPLESEKQEVVEMKDNDKLQFLKYMSVPCHHWNYANNLQCIPYLSVMKSCLCLAVNQNCICIASCQSSYAN